LLHGDTDYNVRRIWAHKSTTYLRGSPCPNEFCLALECTDLANDILHCPHWDPQEISSPHSAKVEPAKYLPADLPFVPAECLDLELPQDDWGKVDDFIDDGIVIVPDLGDNPKRAIQAMLLAIHILFRPVDGQEKIMRDNCLSLGKLKEEGFLTETPIILGWLLNTRSLTISLPTKKFSHWNQDLALMIKSKKTSCKDLEKLIGRLNHAATACPLMR